MSISYEEALGALESMFGENWTRDDLDTVLRNQKGHMENTVDMILRHGDKDPQVLIDQLEHGIDPEATARSMDEQLARQLAQGEQRQAAAAAAAGSGGGESGSSSAPPQQKGRGKPTTLPDDFLRVPGFRPPAAASSGGGSSTVMDDEALARMLQDELFSEELARNPDFAHLARGRPRTVGGRPVRTAGSAPASAAATSRSPGQHQRPSFGNLQQQGDQIIGKISELGDNARRRLQMLAAQFNAQRAGGGGGIAGNVPPQGDSGAASRASASERRGLLDGGGDGDDHTMDDMELMARKDL